MTRWHVTRECITSNGVVCLGRKREMFLSEGRRNARCIRECDVGRRTIKGMNGGRALKATDVGVARESEFGFVESVSQSGTFG
nr:hypothetical protein [Salmonid herpesvirus 1]